MAKRKALYTYRGGEQLPLRERAEELVVRALPQVLAQVGLGTGVQVSSASTRVRCPAAELKDRLAEYRKVAVAHHAYETETGAEFLITDRVIVKFAEPPSDGELDALLNKYSLIMVEALSPDEYVLRLTDHTGCNPIELVVALTEEEPAIAWAEHDLNMRVQSSQVHLPTDPYYPHQWHLHTHLVHQDFDQRASSLCEQAWQLLGSSGSPEVVVGLSDDGCRMDHPDFSDDGKFAAWGYLKGERLVVNTDLDARIEDMYQPGSNHGTSCAGVIAAENDGQRTVGAAPGCRLLPIRWESDERSLFISDSKFARVLDFIADKVDVFSNSWGIVPYSIWGQSVRSRIEALARTGGRRRRGILFLFAAGNDNSPIQHQGNQEIPYTNGWNGDFTRWDGPRTSRVFRNNLVGIDGVMHIAALASTGRRSHYSNYGDGISICAPSSNGHTYHRMQVHGLDVTTTTGRAGGVTATFGGTSSATPLVAGIAALVISADPEQTALEVASVLRRTASKALDLTPYAPTPGAPFDPNPDWDVSPVAPYDVGDFQDIGHPDGTWSPWFGFGRVDALQATQQVRDRPAVVVEHAVYESSPDIGIPDDDPDGIAAAIHVERPGRVQAVQVSVDIQHPWIGDLEVALQHPDGTQVLLHDRRGANTHDIVASYTLDNKPQLAVLHGKTAPGDWLLRVADFYPPDRGQLRAWRLELDLLPEAIRRESSPGVTIPDDDPDGIVEALELPQGTQIRELSVDVDISHPWIGDLRVALQPPGDAAPILLHDHEGGSQDNVRRTWRSVEFAALAALHGHEAGGTWRLHVADTVHRDKGKLNRWAITVAA